MRDALSLTDQAIAYAAGEVTLDAVQGMLGALDQTYLVRLLDALAKQDGADLMVVADEMASRSLSYNGALQDLGTLLHRIALAQTVPGAVPQDLPELADILRLAQEFDPQEVQLYYQIAVHGRNEMGLAPDEYAGFTMTLLRMLAFRPGQGGAEQVAAGAPAPRAAAPVRPAAAAAAAAAAPVPPARAAAAAVASHAAVAPPPPRPPAAAAPAPAAAPGAPAPAMSSARAAINAALEAARSASRGQQPQPKRSTAQSNQAAAAAQEAAPAPVAARPAPPAPVQPDRPAPPPAASAAGGTANSSATPPWQTTAAPSVPAAPAAPSAAYDDSGSEPPSWVTEFSDDTAVAHDSAEVATAPAVTPAAAPVAAPVRAPAAPKHPYVITPVEQIGWDGNWPALAADLPLRGVSQQLAFQTELIECVAQGNLATFRLRVPIDTLRASGNSEKLCAAVQERFPDIKVAIETEIGPVWYTASAEAQAHREACLRTAEQTVAGDAFVQGMIRTFDAFVVPGSIKPAAA